MINQVAQLQDRGGLWWWGVSTSAYQIEGGAGRGPSIWDTFSGEAGRISDGSTGDVACDHFHRYAEDVALMAELGVNAYRLSVAWPRIQPDGTGPANPEGVAFYDRLVDSLLARGIAPVVTLFHWDLPQPLEDKGGWLERDTAHRFAEYADLVAGALGDRVALWITLNEPFVHMSLGYALGVHAPGRTLMYDALPVAHHQLLGHGLAVTALRARGPAPVAIANNYTPVRAHSDSEADVAAATAYDLLHNKLFTDPLFGRGYPLDVPGVRDGDLDTIAAPLDALGVNYYNPTAIRAPAAGSPMPFEQVPLEGYARTGFGWPVVPEGLHTMLTSLKEEYAEALPPIYVTESGCAYPDVVGPDGRCDDPDRVSYLDSHIRAVRQAAADGVDVRGYFVWSLLDNWEWAEGFSQRFGLVHVDFASQVRTPKTSYAWYREVINSAGR
jgi:beta-glucosidase